VLTRKVLRKANFYVRIKEKIKKNVAICFCQFLMLSIPDGYSGCMYTEQFKIVSVIFKISCDKTDKDKVEHRIHGFLGSCTV
jgi:hypothetical protein